jgi:hypothetical protein
MPEVRKAVECGYEIIRTYEIWHYAETSTYDKDKNQAGLFSDYIDTFLKVKQEASGYPNWVVTEEDKEKYIENYKTNEGVLLDKENICYNSGLRAISKISLNSLWGRFGMREHRDTLSFISDPKEYMSMLNDDKITVSNVHYINDNFVSVFWKKNENFLKPDSSVNVVIAAYTTCWARLQLYEVIEQLGPRVCYMDTDSCIYIHKHNSEEYNPATGDYLGQLKSELPSGTSIVKFVAGGPKCYGYQIQMSAADAEGNKTVCKVKGFTMNARTMEKLNFESIKSLVT